MPILRFSFGLMLALPLLAATAPGEETRAQQLSTQFRTAAAKVAPSCVSIETSRGPRELPVWSGRDSQPGEEGGGQGCGTGIVIDRNGYILTCSHVLAGADAVVVKLSNGSRCKVLEVSDDPVTDLAVIRIRCDQQLQVANFGDSDQARVGDWVLSVSSPYGLQESISAGVVSAVDRQLPDVPRTRLIQTDAASNPGSSGGALINLEGDVIGICEGSYGPCEGFHGISFAIPANLAKQVARQLIEKGRISRGYLGCGSQTLTLALAKSLSIPEARGVIITEVSGGSPAAVGQLEVGDVVTHFGNVPVVKNDDMQRVVEQSTPGQPYHVRLIRGAKVATITVTPAEMPVRSREPTQPAAQEHAVSSGFRDTLLGLHVEELTAPASSKLGYGDVDGVLVSKVIVGTPAGDEGVCAGMVIRRLGNQPVRNVREYQAAASSLSKADLQTALISAPDGSRYVTFHLAAVPQPNVHSAAKDKREKR